MSIHICLPDTSLSQEKGELMRHRKAEKGGEKEIVKAFMEDASACFFGAVFGLILLGAIIFIVFHVFFGSF